MMTDYEEVAYVAFIGEPTVEVAVIVTRHGKIVNKFHEFVNYFNVNLEGNQKEMEPITDSWGTRFCHAIGEMELDHVGLPLHVVQERLRLFLSIFGSSLKIIVNESHYNQMKQSFESSVTCRIQWGDNSQRWTWEMLKQALQIAQCTGHRSGHYFNECEPECALRVACIMLMKANT